MSSQERENIVIFENYILICNFYSEKTLLRALKMIWVQLNEFLVSIKPDLLFPVAMREVRTVNIRCNIFLNFVIFMETLSELGHLMKIL